MFPGDRALLEGLTTDPLASCGHYPIFIRWSGIPRRAFFLRRLPIRSSQFGFRVKRIPPLRWGFWELNVVRSSARSHESPKISFRALIALSFLSTGLSRAIALPARTVNRPDFCRTARGLECLSFSCGKSMLPRGPFLGDSSRSPALSCATAFFREAVRPIVLYKGLYGGSGWQYYCFIAAMRANIVDRFRLKRI